MEDKHSQQHFIILGIITVGFIFIWIYQLFAAPPALPVHNDTLTERIKPVGSIYKEGDIAINNTASTSSAAPDTKAVRTAESIYNKSCHTCHAAGVAGAPKLGDKTAWAARIASGIDALSASVINGKGAMPPKGMCMDCSDDELRQTVEYMMEKSN